MGCPWSTKGIGALRGRNFVLPFQLVSSMGLSYARFKLYSLT
ncbi:hypothetical protein KP509_22G003900 [Ceratopteris richardii]|uniref:Uncharacterized protein n=1 Tax=Ceratopteris richardii TaxID=49495 RepID=A0A8T2S279_CERRI|nr:hypothetical protein KP509_22G003900 [Ceratopteris richardii]